MNSCTPLAMGLLLAIAPAWANTDGPASAELVAEGVVHAPPEALWEVFSTASGWRKMGVAKAEVDLRPGGLIRSHYSPDGDLGDPGTIENQIMAYDPGRSMALRIHKTPHDFPFREAWKSTWTVVSFRALSPDRSLLRIAMLGFGDDEESVAMRAFFQQGNAETLCMLQAAFAPADRPEDQKSKDDGLQPIVLSQDIQAPREAAWRALTTAEGWQKFLGVKAKIGSQPGDPFEIYFDATAPAGKRGSEGCKILSLVPSEMFSFSWSAPPQFAKARQVHTWVVVDFTESPDGTTSVRLRHFGFAEHAQARPQQREEWLKVRAYFQSAWTGVLQALADGLH